MLLKMLFKILLLIPSLAIILLFWLLVSYLLNGVLKWPLWVVMLIVVPGTLCSTAFVTYKIKYWKK